MTSGEITQWGYNYLEMQKAVNHKLKAIQFTLLCSTPSLALLLALYIAGQIIHFKVYGDIAVVIMFILLACLGFSIVFAPFLYFFTNNHRLSAKKAALLTIVALVTYAMLLLRIWLT